MAAPFQFFENIEKHVGARPAQQEVAAALEPIVLMRYDDNSCHRQPFDFLQFSNRRL
jgi:hypothetical protein